jgi:thiosulfate/3-mercaptopyruvate sulfurtransferase
MREIQPVVSPQWLVSQLHAPHLVIVDCRFQLADPEWGYQQYLKDHIPGAFYLDLNQDLSAPVGQHGGRHPLPDLEQLAGRLSEIGIVSGESCVVAYDDSRFAFAARLWWLLRYLGHSLVAVLDGGWQNWQKLGYSRSDRLPTAQAGRFIAQPQSGWTVDITEVRTRKDLSAVILIDSRESDRYRGEREPIDPLAGHIPGAVNSPWQQVTDEQGYLHPLPVHQQLWADYQPADELIVYCGSGVTACANLLSMKLAGVKNAKLYPGGWSDWCSYS